MIYTLLGRNALIPPPPRLQKYPLLLADRKVVMIEVSFGACEFLSQPSPVGMERKSVVYQFP